MVQLFEYIELVLEFDLIEIKLHIVGRNSLNESRNRRDFFSSVNKLTPIVTSGDCIVGDN